MAYDNYSEDQPELSPTDLAAQMAGQAMGLPEQVFKTGLQGAFAYHAMRQSVALGFGVAKGELRYMGMPSHLGVRTILGRRLAGGNAGLAGMRGFGAGALLGTALGGGWKGALGGAIGMAALSAAPKSLGHILGRGDKVTHTGASGLLQALGMETKWFNEHIVENRNYKFSDFKAKMNAAATEAKTAEAAAAGGAAGASAASEAAQAASATVPGAVGSAVSGVDVVNAGQAAGVSEVAKATGSVPIKEGIVGTKRHVSRKDVNQALKASVGSKEYKRIKRGGLNRKRIANARHAIEEGFVAESPITGALSEQIWRPKGYNALHEDQYPSIRKIVGYEDKELIAKGTQAVIGEEVVKKGIVAKGITAKGAEVATVMKEVQKGSAAKAFGRFGARAAGLAGAVGIAALGVSSVTSHLYRGAQVLRSNLRDMNTSLRLTEFGGRGSFTNDVVNTERDRAMSAMQFLRSGRDWLGMEARLLSEGFNG